MNKAVKAILILLTLVVLAATVGAGLYWLNWKNNPPVKAISVKATPEKVEIGQPVKIEIDIQTPWYRKVDGPPTMDFVENVAMTEPKFEFDSYNLSGKLWKVSLSLLLFTEGEFKDLKVTLPLSPDRMKKQKDLTVNLPILKAHLSGVGKSSSIEVKENLDSSALTPENAELQEAKSYLWLWIVGISLALLLAIFPFLKKNVIRPVKIIPPWESALNAIEELKSITLDDEAFFVRLTDILRQYIEKRFSLQATEKTSEEFIQEIRQDSILSQKQQIALENFLSTADLVKFARMAADKKQRQECLNTADEFVHETIPSTEEARA